MQYTNARSNNKMATLNDLEALPGAPIRISAAQKAIAVRVQGRIFLPTLGYRKFMPRKTNKNYLIQNVCNLRWPGQA